MDTSHKCLQELPRTLKIGAFDWSVVCLDEDSGDCANALFETNEIKLWAKNISSPDRVVGSVIHECLHIIFDDHDLDKIKRGKDREEIIITGFEAGLVSLFRDNPKFVLWMKKWLR